MALVLNRAQRDAVYRFVVSDLARAGGLALALEEGEIPTAERLRQQFDQAVRLLDQIEWIQSGSRDRYEVTLAEADVQGLFERLYEDSTRVINEAITEFTDAVLKEAFSVAEVSGTVLGRRSSHSVSSAVASGAGARLVCLVDRVGDSASMACTSSATRKGREVSAQRR